jgi:2-polyprenyl-3-methyl-5-hydroxy-6-metoxy-1,4-benzoquinol methylase
MKISTQLSEQFNSHDLVTLIESAKSSAKTLGKSKVWVEDLAIYMGYNYDPTHPSVRLRRLNLRKPLREIGVKADIIYRYEDLLPYQNILLSHFDETLAEQCLELRKMGKTLYFCHTEHLWGLPSQIKVFNLCDYIVCCSNKLKELTQANLTSAFTECYFLPDMAEQNPTKKVHQPQEKEKLRCVYVGMGGNSYLAKDLRPMIESLGMELTVITEWDDADIKWDQDTYLDIMAEHDIAICPQNVAAQPAKSHVKVITAMSVGLPLICSPNPAYVELIKYGLNGFVASTQAEWRDCLSRLKDLNLRKSMSYNALHTAQNYTPHAISFYWLELLCRKKKPSVALINDTLKQKYLSYGDSILEELHFYGYPVEEFRYEDVSSLPQGYDLYVFVERRYEVDDISNVSPRILLTREKPDLNTLPHFDTIVTTEKAIVDYCKNRGFVNIFYQPTFNMDHIINFSKLDVVEERKIHNESLHSTHIDAFHHLQPPETRWSPHHVRDYTHIEYTMNKTEYDSRVLDIGSADGWLSLYLATQGRKVSAMDFVKRGMDWTRQHADRLGVNIDLRFGFIEDLFEVFHDKKFDCILAYEILEHLDYRRLPWYLEKMESLLDIGGKILISLPKQDLHDNPEHLWSPSEKLIKKVFENKPCYQLQWVEIPNHGVPGNWFISYLKG